MKTRTQRSLSLPRVSRAIVAIATAIGACQSYAADTSSNTSQLDRSETSFIKEAYHGGIAEVEMGKTALLNAQNSQIKQLGEHLREDHSKAGQELAQIAQKNGITLTADVKRSDNRELNKLQKQTGAEFDKAFADAAIKDHTKDIDKYQKALRDTKNPELRAYIEKNIPVLKQHLQMARNAGSAVGVDQRTLSSADKYLSDTQTGLGTAPGSQTGTSINRTDRGATDHSNDHRTHTPASPNQNSTDRNTNPDRSTTNPK